MMRRWIPLLLLSIFFGGWLTRGQAAPHRPTLDCTFIHCTFVPLVTKSDAPPPTATPVTPTVAPPATPNCSLPSSSNVPNAPIAITTVNKVAETVTLKNVSAQTVDVSGWWICSVTGNQLHAVLNDTLAPGQIVTIASQAGGPIWNNSITDPAALYDRYGTQVSYRSQ